MLMLMNLAVIQILLLLPVDGSEGYHIWRTYGWGCTSFGLSAVFLGQMILSAGWNRWLMSAVFGAVVAICTLIGAWAQQAYLAGSYQFAISPPFVEATINNFGPTRIALVLGFLTVANTLLAARILVRFEHR